jgi:hypothetical protein
LIEAQQVSASTGLVCETLAMLDLTQNKTLRPEEQRRRDIGAPERDAIAR